MSHFPKRFFGSFGEQNNLKTKLLRVCAQVPKDCYSNVILFLDGPIKPKFRAFRYIRRFLGVSTFFTAKNSNPFGFTYNLSMPEIRCCKAFTIFKFIEETQL
jgi:hypothetical protein